MTDGPDFTKYTSQYPRCVAMMKELGIDTRAVLIDGISVTGYDKGVLDEQGDFVFSNDKFPLATRVTWPNRELGVMVMIEFAKDMAQMFAAIEFTYDEDDEQDED